MFNLVLLLLLKQSISYLSPKDLLETSRLFLLHFNDPNKNFIYSSYQKPDFFIYIDKYLPTVISYDSKISNMYYPEIKYENLKIYITFNMTIMFEKPNFEAIRMFKQNMGGYLYIKQIVLIGNEAGEFRTVKDVKVDTILLNFNEYRHYDIFKALFDSDMAQIKEKVTKSFNDNLKGILEQYPITKVKKIFNIILEKLNGYSFYEVNQCEEVTKAAFTYTEYDKYETVGNYGILTNFKTEVTYFTTDAEWNHNKIVLEQMIIGNDITYSFTKITPERERCIFVEIMNKLYDYAIDLVYENIN